MPCVLKLDLFRYGCQRCTLAVALHCHASARGRSIFGKYLNAHLKFTVYGRKRTVGRTYTHTSAQCSSASVGLAQARPNNTIALFPRLMQIMWGNGLSILHVIDINVYLQIGGGVSDRKNAFYVLNNER